jgi:cytoskeletal protein RodZ
MPKTLGQVLKESREARGLSLADVSFQTKIREYYLDALEKDQISKLPSSVQGRGFLRNYASFLNLDEGLLMEGWFHPEHIVFEKENPPSSELIEPEPFVDDTQEETLPAPAGPIAVKPGDIEEPEEQIIVIHEFTDDPQALASQAETYPPEMKASQKTFIEIGDKLKNQRELLNLSVEDIERFTNIRAHYLKALENGDLEQLPSVVQGKGMLSNYSNFLNMDSEDILLRFAEGLQTKRNEQYAPQKLDLKNPPKPKQPNIASPGWQRFITADLLIVGTLIVALFVFILWGAANVSKNQNSPDTATAPSLSDMLLTEPGTVVVNPLALATSVPTQITGNTISNESPLAENENPLAEGESTLESTAEQEEGAFPISLSIVANQRAYLKITSDNRVVFMGRVVPGNAYEFSGSELVELLTGNAGALDIYFNQEQIGSIGGIGEVKTLIFGADQTFATPTAQSTPVSTSTLAPTATQTPTRTSTPVPVTSTPSPSVTPYIP